jgi:GMP synthase (glutamine-hydrolysing)
MKMHIIKNAPYEGPGHIADWALVRDYEVKTTSMFEDAATPPVESFDWLVIMGGPMSVHDEKEHPWLIREKALIENAIARNKIVLGVCLGAQLIAEVLGARVYKNEYIERGWHTIKREPGAQDSQIFNSFPQEFTAFLWHGDTFDLPKDANLIASSEACANHAFEYSESVVGLQFHLEVTPEGITSILDHSSYPKVMGNYVQTREQITDRMENVGSINTLMDQLLQKMSNRF